MSKSKGNVVYPEPIVDALNSFGAPGNDALRYYLLREAPFGQDTSFTYDALIQRYNSDLANGLGNLASRTVAMIHRYFDGAVPTNSSQSGAWRGISLRADFNAAALELRRCFENFDFSNGLDSAWRVISQTNRYLVDTEPWAKAEDPSQRQAVADSLYTAAETLRFVAALLHPILPASTQELWAQLGQPGKVQDQSLEELMWGSLKPGTKVGKPEPIFPRLDKEKTLAKLHELAEADYERDKPKEALKPVETESAKPSEPLTPNPESRPPAPTPDSLLPTPGVTKISIEDFAKVEMRVGEVLSAEPIPSAIKLLKLQLDIGTEVRQVCAGIAEYYAPEQLVGMKVILVTNLQPRKLRGVESDGMVLAASVGEHGKPILATFKEDVPKGARLK